LDSVPLLRGTVVGRTADTLTLRSGIVLAAYPCRPPAIRGLRARIAVLDELGFYRNAEGNPQDVEMLRAVRPTLATTGGRLVILSSPAGQSGALWDLYRLHFARDEAPILVWRGSAPEMNPTLPADYLQRMEQDDPEGYRSEVLGEFRAGVSALFDPEMLEACVARGVRERPPEDGVTYQAAADPSGGRRDAFTVAIGHQVGDRIVVDVVRDWAAPFNPSGVVAEASDLCAATGSARSSRTTSARSGSSSRSATRDHLSRRGARPEPALPGTAPDRQRAGHRAPGPAAAPPRATGPRTTPGRVGPRSHRALAARAR
jgi:hypothetical protein